MYGNGIEKDRDICSYIDRPKTELDIHYPVSTTFLSKRMVLNGWIIVA